MASPTNSIESTEPEPSLSSLSGTLSSRPSLSALSTKDLIPPSRLGQSSPSPDTGNTITPGSSYPSHSRSQSMAEQHFNSISTPASDNMLPATSDLVRRHHTLSTSAASKLVRQERSRVRQALANVPDLSEDDRQYYIPSSPVDSIQAWSDLGHSGSSIVRDHSPAHNASAHRHGRNMSHSDARNIGQAPEAAYLPRSNIISSSSGYVPPSPPASKSTFVVLRGAKGDAALSERRMKVEGTRGDTESGSGLKHRNSLKEFLMEAESQGLAVEDAEEWERSLQDEREKETHSLYQDIYRAPPNSSPYQTTTFSLPVRANTLSHSHQRSIGSVTGSDAWNNNDSIVTSDLTESTLRRPHSLNFPQRLRHTPSSENWRTSRPTHARSPSEELLSDFAIDGVPTEFARSQSNHNSESFPMTTTAPYTPSLSHSNSVSSHHSHSHRPASLSHSNSVNSHHSHQSQPLSPIGGLARSPWSPTFEETKQLGIANAAVGSAVLNGPGLLSRRESGSSRGSFSGGISTDTGDINGRFGSTGLTSPNTVGDDSLPTVLATSISRFNTLPLSRTASPNRQLPPLLTSPDALAYFGNSPLPFASRSPNQPSRQYSNSQGPASAAPFVPQIGHSHMYPSPATPANDPGRSIFSPQPQQNPYTQQQAQPTHFSPPQHSYAMLISDPHHRGHHTAAPGEGGTEWLRQKDLLTGASTSAPIREGWSENAGYEIMQQQQQIQVLQNQMQSAMAAMDLMNREKPAAPGHVEGSVGERKTSSSEGQSVAEVDALIRAKGYNPTSFDVRPPNARFFVIKSYTEEDVHKSLKHEIWASTDLGNKRLDRAFRESGEAGPIYLFFSVNGSGHFAGMAQMLTPVDYTTSSNVWASDKWKGVFSLKWIYIKDVPLASLRHIRLANTPENKPVTSSRDTQEVPYEAGCEVLRIISTFSSRTTLLQDSAWYDTRDPTDVSSTSSTPPPPHYPTRTPAKQSQQPQQPQQQQQHHQQQQFIRPPFVSPQQYPYHNQFQPVNQFVTQFQHNQFSAPQHHQFHPHQQHLFQPLQTFLDERASGMRQGP